MRPFTDEEFGIMVSEMTGKAHPSFDMLCTIAKKTLKPKIKYWCSVDPVLRGRGEEDDIMQEVFKRLIKTAMHSFLKRDDNDGEINRDPDEFRNWMITVAKRIKIDKANELRKTGYRERGFEDGEAEQIPDSSCGDDRETAYKQAVLAAAFTVVIESDARVYKILTWLAQSLFIMDYSIAKISSNDAIIAAFSEKTLFEMKDTLFELAEKYDWIVITAEQAERIDRALNAEFKDKRIGDFRYESFFMKKGGKASISDWVNRMNRLIESRIKR